MGPPRELSPGEGQRQTRKWANRGHHVSGSSEERTFLLRREKEPPPRGGSPQGRDSQAGGGQEGESVWVCEGPAQPSGAGEDTPHLRGCLGRSLGPHLSGCPPQAVIWMQLNTLTGQAGLDQSGEPWVWNIPPRKRFLHHHLLPGTRYLLNGPAARGGLCA